MIFSWYLLKIKNLGLFKQAMLGTVDLNIVSKKTTGDVVTATAGVTYRPWLESDVAVVTVFD